MSALVLTACSGSDTTITDADVQEAGQNVTDQFDPLPEGVSATDSIYGQTAIDKGANITHQEFAEVAPGTCTVMEAHGEDTAVAHVKFETGLPEDDAEIVLASAIAAHCDELD